MKSRNTSFNFFFSDVFHGYFLLCYEYKLKSPTEKGFMKLSNFSLGKQLGVFWLEMGEKIIF